MIHSDITGILQPIPKHVNVGLYDETYQHVQRHNILYWDQKFMSTLCQNDLKNAVFTEIKCTVAFEILFGQ